MAGRVPVTRESNPQPSSSSCEDEQQTGFLAGLDTRKRKEFSKPVLRKRFEKFKKKFKSLCPDSINIVLHINDLHEGYIAHVPQDTPGSEYVFNPMDDEEKFTYFGPVSTKTIGAYEEMLKSVDPSLLPEMTENQEEFLRKLAEADASRSLTYPQSSEHIPEAREECSSSNQECSSEVELYWHASCQGFHDTRGKQFVHYMIKKMLNNLNMVVEYSTGGRDRFMDLVYCKIDAGSSQIERNCSRLKAVQKQKSSSIRTLQSNEVQDKAAQASTAESVKAEKSVEISPDFFCQNLSKFLPLHIPLQCSPRTVSDVYVRRRDGQIVLLAEIASTSEETTSRLAQLKEKMLFALAPGQKHMIGLLVRLGSIRIVEYLRVSSKPEIIKREESKYEEPFKFRNEFQMYVLWGYIQYQMKHYHKDM